MTRITRKHLDALIVRLNSEMGTPVEPYTKKDDGTYTPNVGNFHLSGAYGGWNVNVMVNEHGGVDCPLSCGHIPARELYNRIHAFLNGYRCAKART